MKRSMKLMNAFRGMAIALLCVLVSLAAIACGETPAGPGGDPVAPAITNKPEGGSLSITDTKDWYQFEIANYDGTVEWISTVTSVAVISNSGLLTMKTKGSTEVIVRNTADNSLSDSVVLTIADNRTPVVDREYDLEIQGAPTAAVRVGHDNIQLTAKDKNEDEAVTVTWESNNPSVATVNETSGLLSIVGKGTATIKATLVDDDTVTDSITLTVLGKAVENVVIESVPKYGMLASNNYPLGARIEPSDAADYEVQWEIIDGEDYASVVIDTGEVTALAAGSCTVKVTVTGEGMEEKSCEETITVYAADPAHTDFRFAYMNDNHVEGTALKAISLLETTGEIIDLGNAEENMALQITTPDYEDKTTYNYVEFNFGTYVAGSYKIMLRFDVQSGEHEGSLAIPGSDPYTTLTAMSYSGSTYTLLFNHATAGDLIVRIINAKRTASVVIIDDISIEEFEGDAAALGNTPVTFDGETNLAQNGIHALFGAELTEENGSLTVAGGSVALFVGDVTKGRYNLKLDVTLEGGYPAIGKIVSGAGADATGVFWSSGLETLVGAETGLTAYARKSGENTYTMILTFADDYASVAIILCDSAETSGGSMTLDNLSFEKETYATAVTIADFESGAITTGNWNTGFALKYAAASNFDFQAGSSNANNLTIVSAAQETVGEGQINHYYRQNTTSVNYIRFLVGYLPAGTYEFTVRAKVESGNGALQITLTTGATTNPTQLDYHSNAAGGAFTLRAGSAGDAKNATWGIVGQDDAWGGTFNSTTWTTYKCTLELTQDWYVRFGIGRGTGSNQTGTVCVDDITVVRTA